MIFLNINFSFFLAMFGAVLFLISFCIYNKNIIKKETKPSIVGWGLFVIITGVNSPSYLQMSGDLVKTILAFTDLFTCIIILCLSLLMGNLRKLNKEEVLATCFTFIAIILWVMFSATHGNLFLQAGLIAAFMPIFRNAYQRRETILPWLLWATAFFLSVIVVLLRWSNHYEDLINPCLEFLLHLGVGIVAWRRNLTHR